MTDFDVLVRNGVNLKKALIIFVVLALILPLASCAGDKGVSTSAVSGKQGSGIASEIISAAYDSDDFDSNWTGSKMSYITLKGNSIALDGDGAVVDGNRIAITSAGTYYISGKLDDGQIIVRSEDQETVKLVFYGVDITCSTGSPVYIYKAKKTVITLADDAKNYVTDGASYILADSETDEPNAAIFSKDDLTINGSGSLTINANYYNGIQSKDDLKITGGNITVNAVNDGIKGRDSISIRNANITVNAGGDGLQSTNDTDTERGYVAIESGTLNITAGKDGIQAQTNVTISGGNITVACVDDGMHAESSLEIDGGEINITGCYEGLESAAITINDGNIHIVSSDDGINVVGGNDGFAMMGPPGQVGAPPDGRPAQDDNLTMMRQPWQSDNFTVNGGPGPMGPPPDGQPWQSDNFTMMRPPRQSDNFTMNGQPGQNGNFTMNWQPGQNGNPPLAGQPGQDNFASSGDNYLNINGGYIAVNAMGDGFDIGGSINMTGGVVVINGPTANDNGALDHMGFKMTGGFLVAVGSSGMAQAPGTSSTQHAVMLNLTSSQPAGVMVHIATEDGGEILTFAPVRAYQSVVLSSPELRDGSTYIVYSGGSSTGIVADGLYSGGAYTSGTEALSFTITGIVTTAGSAGGGFPGGAGGNMPPGGMQK